MTYYLFLMNSRHLLVSFELTCFSLGVCECVAFQTFQQLKLGKNLVQLINHAKDVHIPPNVKSKIQIYPGIHIRYCYPRGLSCFHRLTYAIDYV